MKLVIVDKFALQVELATSSLTYTYPSSRSAKLQIGTSKMSLSHYNINHNQISVLHIANMKQVNLVMLLKGDLNIGK